MRKRATFLVLEIVSEKSESVKQFSLSTRIFSHECFKIEKFFVVVSMAARCDTKKLIAFIMKTSRGPGTQAHLHKAIKIGLNTTHTVSPH